jgi:hypothetical protein
MKFGAIASTLLGVIGTSAAFTVHWRISAGVPLVSKDIHGSGSANFRRSMVAMEPEKAVGNNEKVDQMKPPTSILKPEDLMEEIDEASGFSQWQRSYDGDDEEDDDIFENAFSNELEKSTVEEEEEEAEEVLQAREIEENLEEELDVAVEADAEAEEEEESATEETFAFEEDGGADESKGLEVAAEAEVESTKVNPIAMASKNVAKLNFIFRILNRAMSPIFGREIERNVPKNTIKGAWITGAIISMMGGLDPFTSVFTASGLSYISITPGSAGDIVRAAGEATWDAGLIALKVTTKITSVFGIGYNTYAIPVVDSSNELIPRDGIAVGEEIEMLVEEIEETVNEVETVLENANKAREFESQADEAERLSEEARLAEIEYLLEEAKIEKEAKEAEEEYLAEEARLMEEEALAEMARLEEEARLAEEELLAEEARLEEEERLAELARLEEEERIAEAERLQEEERLAEIARAEEEARLAEEKLAQEERLAEMARLEEEARLAEEERLAEEARLEEEAARLAEEERLAEMARLKEEARLAEEERLAEEAARLAEEERLAEEARLAKESALEEDDEEDEDYISDEEWEASIQLAEGLSPDITGERGGWDAARQLAKDLVDEAEEEPFRFNNPDLNDQERMEEIGREARLAVEQFEALRQQEEDDEEEFRKNEVESLLSVLQEFDEDDTLDENKVNEVESFSIEKQEVNGLEDEVVIEEKPDYSKMTVVVLKDILRSRGLKVSGKKALLVQRLQEDDEK